jgi:CheY-like chemotaxis protein
VPTSDDRPDAPLGGPPDLLRDRERLRALLDYRASAPLSDPGLDVDRLMERLSRELRTPLNAVLGFAQLLRLDVSEGDRQAAVDEILRAGGELQVVPARLVGAAEAPAPLAAPPEPVDLRRTTRGAVLHVASTAGAGQVDVREDPASGPEVLVSADQDLLEAVVREAVQAGVRRTVSTLSWSCASEQGRAVLTLVADAPPGPGLAALPTELGLAVARRLAGLLGGSLSVAPGPGGERTLVLDLPGGGSGTVRRPPAPADLSVLYVEDNPSNVRLVERLLERRPMTSLLVARTGEEGLALARAARPDLVLLDLHLPDLPGEQVLDRLLAQQGVPVAVLSADALPTTVDDTLARGAVAYLTKPLVVAELYALLDGAQARREGEQAS